MQENMHEYISVCVCMHMYVKCLFVCIYVSKQAYICK